MSTPSTLLWQRRGRQHGKRWAAPSANNTHPAYRSVLLNARPSPVAALRLAFGRSVCRYVHSGLAGAPTVYRAAALAVAKAKVTVSTLNVPVIGQIDAGGSGEHNVFVDLQSAAVGERPAVTFSTA